MKGGPSVKGFKGDRSEWHLIGGTLFQQTGFGLWSRDGEKLTFPPSFDGAGFDAVGAVADGVGGDGRQQRRVRFEVVATVEQASVAMGRERLQRTLEAQLARRLIGQRL